MAAGTFPVLPVSLALRASWWKLPGGFLTSTDDSISLRTAGLRVISCPPFCPAPASLELALACCRVPAVGPHVLTLAGGCRAAHLCVWILESIRCSVVCFVLCFLLSTTLKTSEEK